MNDSHSTQDALSQSVKPNLGPWLGATSESIALCANVDGHGVVLKCVGRTIRTEVGAMGPGLEDLQLDNAPNGLSIWEGVYEWVGDDDEASVEPNGKFRPLTPEEWARLAATGTPWEIAANAGP